MKIMPINVNRHNNSNIFKKELNFKAKVSASFWAKKILKKQIEADLNRKLSSKEFKKIFSDFVKMLKEVNKEFSGKFKLRRKDPIPYVPEYTVEIRYDGKDSENHTLIFGRQLLPESLQKTCKQQNSVLKRWNSGWMNSTE